jgi:hypothetical protein
MAKVNKEIQKLFLKLLNFTPELLAKTQQEAKRQNISFDALIRATVEKYLKAVTVEREQQEVEFGDSARMRLRAHFAEDRNEFLTEDDIRKVAQRTQ